MVREGHELMSWVAQTTIELLVRGQLGVPAWRFDALARRAGQASWGAALSTSACASLHLHAPMSLRLTIGTTAGKPNSSARHRRPLLRRDSRHAPDRHPQCSRRFDLPSQCFPALPVGHQRGAANGHASPHRREGQQAVTRFVLSTLSFFLMSR